jgi:hypothetical protein
VFFFFGCFLDFSCGLFLFFVCSARVGGGHRGGGCVCMCLDCVLFLTRGFAGIVGELGAGGVRGERKGNERGEEESGGGAA